MFCFHVDCLLLEILVTAISKMRQEIERRTSGDGPPQQHMGEVWNEVAKPAFGESLTTLLWQHGRK